MIGQPRSGGGPFRTGWVALLLGLAGTSCGPGARSIPRDRGTVGTGQIGDLAGLRHRYPPARQCAGCHPDHYGQWTASFHAQSLRTEGFLKLFSRFETAMEDQGRHGRDVAMACFGCHAPLLKEATDQVVNEVAKSVLAGQVEELVGLEVGCVACHQQEGGVVYDGPIRDPVVNPFHGSAYSPTPESAQACARCHGWIPPAVACSTVSADWERSRAAREGRTCQSCHMEKRSAAAALAGPPRKVHGHAFPGGRSADLLGRSVELGLDAAFVKDQLTATVSIRNLAAHRIPDG